MLVVLDLWEYVASAHMVAPTWLAMYFSGAQIGTTLSSIRYRL